MKILLLLIVLASTSCSCAKSTGPAPVPIRGEARYLDLRAESTVVETGQRLFLVGYLRGAGYVVRPKVVTPRCYTPWWSAYASDVYGRLVEVSKTPGPEVCGEGVQRFPFFFRFRQPGSFMVVLRVMSNDVELEKQGIQVDVKQKETR